MDSCHVLHEGRKAGANFTGKNASRDETRRLGGWQGNVHDEVYRTEQSIKTLLAASGLRPQPNASEGGKYLYSIPRQRAKPPTELQEMIFPFVTNELAEVRQVN